MTKTGVAELDALPAPSPAVVSNVLNASAAVTPGPGAAPNASDEDDEGARNFHALYLDSIAKQDATRASGGGYDDLPEPPLSLSFLDTVSPSIIQPLASAAPAPRAPAPASNTAVSAPDLGSRSLFPF